MVSETPKSNMNNNNNSNLTKEQLAIVKANLLSPTEVTFRDVSDSDKSSINSRTKKYKDADADSIASSVNSLPKKKLVIPDGGWGWVTVFSSLMLSAIIDGVSFSFGLLYTQFLNHFRESESKTSWIGSLFLAIPLMSGPIMSNLVDKYGCRIMTMIGGVISTIGFILASMSNSVEMLYLTFGFIGGLGLGICYVTAVVIVCLWFEKKRTFATGIGASGTGIGTFLYAPFTQALIEYFGWRGTILVIAGTMFNICVCGALMREPEWVTEENNLKKLESRSQSINTFSNSSVCLDEIKKLLDSGARKEDVLQTLVTNCNTEANTQIPNNEDHSKKYQSQILLPTYIEDNIRGSRRSLRDKKNLNNGYDLFQSKSPQSDNTQDKANLASVETLSPSEKATEMADDSPTGSENRRLSLDENALYAIDDMLGNNLTKPKGMSLQGIDETSVLVTTPVRAVIVPIGQSSGNPDKLRQRSVNKTREDYHKRNLSVKNSHYFHNMRIHRNSIHYRGAMMNTHRYRLKASSCPNIYRNSMTTIALEDDEVCYYSTFNKYLVIPTKIFFYYQKWYDTFVDVIKSVFDFSLFLEVKFFFFSVSTLFLFIWQVSELF